MQDSMLFPNDPAEPTTTAKCSEVTDAPPPPPPPPPPPRLRRPDRMQVLLRPCSLEEVLPPGHQVRTLWAVVERLDLSRFYQPLKARGAAPGRSATDPQLLVALWLWAATQGVGSARRLARLCQEHDAYRWLCGGVNVNYHTISDFRTDHEQALDELFTLVLAMLIGRGLVSVKRISQDGMRVRASAGQSSFKREQKLIDALAVAKAQVEALKQQREAEQRGEQSGDDDDESEDRRRRRTERQRAAQERAARERQARVEQALAQMPELKAIKAKHNGKKSKQPPRASTTDAEARKMKMADGGFRPAYNVQLASDPQSRAIVGVAVSDLGTDQPHSQPMRQQVEQRTGETVEDHLMDGGFIKFEALEQAAADGVTIYAPPKKPSDDDADPYAPLPRDSEAVAAWRQRMGTAAAQAIYKLRAAVSETVNADLRTWRGVDRFLVRGLHKTRCVVLWSALAYNLMHFGRVLLS
jgi:transposase